MMRVPWHSVQKTIKCAPLLHCFYFYCQCSSGNQHLPCQACQSTEQNRELQTEVAAHRACARKVRISRLFSSPVCSPRRRDRAAASIHCFTRVLCASDSIQQYWTPIKPPASHTHRAWTRARRARQSGAPRLAQPPRRPPLASAPKRALPATRRQSLLPPHRRPPHRHHHHHHHHHRHWPRCLPRVLPRRRPRPHQHPHSMASPARAHWAPCLAAPHRRPPPVQRRAPALRARTLVPQFEVAAITIMVSPVAVA